MVIPVNDVYNSIVQFGDLPPVFWSTAKPGLLIPGNVEIWRFNLNSYLDKILKLYELLDDEEQAKSSKFYSERDRQMFIISKALLRKLLGGYLNTDPRKISFFRGRNRKPHLKNECNSGIHFNVSHSEQCILIAICDDEVGIDIEYYKHMTILEADMNNIFSAAEVSFIRDYKPHEEAFNILWTRKEALLKATSQGILDNMTLVPCLNGTHVVNKSMLHSSANWFVYSFEAENHYAASVAFKGRDKKLTFNDFDT